MSNNLTISVINSQNDFFALKDDWNNLVDLDDKATIFQTWEFQYHIWCIFAETVELCIVLVRNERGELVGCAPFGIQEWKFGPLSVRILGFACIRFCDYSSFIINNEYEQEVIHELTEWLNNNIELWDTIVLKPLREDSRLIDNQKQLIDNLNKKVLITQIDVAPYINIQHDWKEYIDIFDSKNTKRAAKYKIRKLFKRFDGTFQSIYNGEALDEAFNQLMNLHQKRIRQKNQLGTFADVKSRIHFQALIRDLSFNKHVRIHAIGSEKETIASICTFVFRDVVSYYQGGFDPNFQHLSPGNVVMNLRIDEALKDKIKEYDFLTGDENYKYTWANEKRKIYSFKIHTQSWKGVLYNWIISIRTLLLQSDALRGLYLKLFSGN